MIFQSQVKPLLHKKSTLACRMQSFNFSVFIVFESKLKLTEENFDLVNEWRRGCREGDETNFLEPSKSCKDQFTIGTKCFNHGTFHLKQSIPCITMQVVSVYNRLGD